MNFLQMYIAAFKWIMACSLAALTAFAFYTLVLFIYQSITKH